MWDRTAQVRVLVDLHKARRRQRIADFDIFEGLYKTYVTGILGAAAVLVLSGLTGDGRLSAASVAQAGRHGAGYVGLAVSLMWAVGFRSGGRGGPVVVEAADVRHVLLAPVDRAVAMRRPAIRQLRFLSLVGLVSGAIGGLVAHQRLPGPEAEWVLSGAAVGLGAVASSAGLAMITSGLRLGRVRAGLLALAVLAWSGLDVRFHVDTSPASLLGELALSPLRFRLGSLGGLAFSLAVVVLGLSAVGGTSLEAAERRAGLVGQIRFAATLQDLRTVIVLRRQLAQEQARSRPWIRLGRALQVGGTGYRRRHFPIWRRSWQGILRYPGTRYLRMAALGVVAGLCLVGVWAGTSALVVPAGLAMYVVGLDSVEPLAEELDHPDIQNQIALPAGWLHLRQLLPSALLCVVAGIIAIAGAVAVGGGYLALEVGAVALIPAALGGAAGAALSVVNGPPPAASVSGMLPPELAGSLVMLRLIVPPLLAVLGCLPVLVARHAWHNHERVAAAELLLALPMLGLIALGLVWVRFSEDIKAWWQTQLELMKTTQRSPRGQ